MSKAKVDDSTRNTFQSTADELSHGLLQLEEPIRRLHNLAYGIRMLASSYEMPKEPGAVLDTMADLLVEGLNRLNDEWNQLQSLSVEAVYPPKDRSMKQAA